MRKKLVLHVLVAAALAIGLAPGANAAADEWKFGIGTGLTSFSMDGDVGFPTAGGGVIFDVDFDNSDTADLLDSAFGLGGYAAKGKWKILFTGGTATLEDENPAFNGEWDRIMIELDVVYTFAQTEKNTFGALFGGRYTDHDWEFTISPNTRNISDDWTDGVIGLTHAFQFADKWSWFNRADYAAGGSEGSYLLRSGVNWMATQHWSFNFALQQVSIEFGEEDDINNSDFYLYDVDEPGVQVGFLYNW